METEDQSQIPTHPLPQAGPGEPPPDASYRRLNGKPLPAVADTRLASGHLAVRGASIHPIRDVEVLNLDGLSEAEARKAAGIAE